MPLPPPPPPSPPPPEVEEAVVVGGLWRTGSGVVCIVRSPVYRGIQWQWEHDLTSAANPGSSFFSLHLRIREVFFSPDLEGSFLRLRGTFCCGLSSGEHFPANPDPQSIFLRLRRSSNSKWCFISSFIMSSFIRIFVNPFMFLNKILWSKIGKQISAKLGCQISRKFRHLLLEKQNLHSWNFFEFYFIL